jgi:hypothetical protein
MGVVADVLAWDGVSVTEAGWNGSGLTRLDKLRFAEFTVAIRIKVLEAHWCFLLLWETFRVFFESELAVVIRVPAFEDGLAFGSGELLRLSAERPGGSSEPR